MQEKERIAFDFGFELELALELVTVVGQQSYNQRERLSFL